MKNNDFSPDNNNKLLLRLDNGRAVGLVKKKENTIFSDLANYITHENYESVAHCYFTVRISVTPKCEITVKSNGYIRTSLQSHIL